MKKIKLISNIIILSIILISCEDAGVTRRKLNGNEYNLPEELKGLKVYNVSIGEGEYVKVGILNNNAISTTYPSGKTHQTIIILNHKDNKAVEVKEILMENDSLIVCRK